PHLRHVTAEDSAGRVANLVRRRRRRHGAELDLAVGIDQTHRVCEAIPVGVVGPALHRALVTVSTAEHRRLDHWLPRTASHIALAAREIFLGLAVELLLAAHRAEVIGLALVRGLRRSLGRLHGHLADGINSHRLPPSILTVASQWVSSPAN